MLKKSKNDGLYLQKMTRFERLEWFISAEHAASLCHRCPNTVKRWIHGAPIDPACHELIMLKVFGLLPIEGWTDYRLLAEGLKTPSGDIIDAERLDAIGIHLAILSDLKEQNQVLMEKIRQLTGNRLTGN